MRTIKIIVIGILCISVFACKSNQLNKTKNDNAKKDIVNTSEIKHWSYEGETGPEHWEEFEKEADCGGMFQSPINIISVDAKTDASLMPLDIHYASQTKIHDVVNNGHSIQYNFEKGDYINYKGEKFELKQIHFHEASEHTINGVRFPIVIHLVHVSQDKEFLVLAVMAQEGKSSVPFEFLENYFPIKKGQTKIVNSSFDLNENLPKDKGYYNYIGSLTTPPCTEGVNWFVFKNPIEISFHQVSELQKLMPLNNYRNVQPLNGRQVLQTK